MKSKSAVHHFGNEDGKFLVTFTIHDGYFHTDDRKLQEKIREAHRDGREISFTFDRNLKITSIE